MSSPDSRVVSVENDYKQEHILIDRYWPALGFRFEASPEELNAWATNIFHASEFLELFDGEKP